MGGRWYPTSLSVASGWLFVEIDWRVIANLLCNWMYPKSQAVSDRVIALFNAQLFVSPVSGRLNDDTGQARGVGDGFEKLDLVEQPHKLRNTLGVALQNAVNN